MRVLSAMTCRPGPLMPMSAAQARLPARPAACLRRVPPAAAWPRMQGSRHPGPRAPPPLVQPPRRPCCPPSLLLSDAMCSAVEHVCAAAWCSQKCAVVSNAGSAADSCCCASSIASAAAVHACSWRPPHQSPGSVNTPAFKFDRLLFQQSICQAPVYSHNDEVWRGGESDRRWMVAACRRPHQPAHARHPAGQAASD